MSPFHGKFQKTVIIVSSGRTGTMALATHLDRCYPNVRALHEPRPSWRLRIASIKAHAGLLSRDHLAHLLEKHRRRLLGSINEPIYIESNPLLQGFIEAFDDVFENPLIVHVVRDPRAFVRSSINFGTFRGLKFLASTYFPYWLSKPEHFAGRFDKKWSQMHPIERMAWFWRIVNEQLLKGESIYGPRYLRIRFEDLFAKDGTGLNHLTDWIGLPRSPRLNEEASRENVNASKRQTLGPWPTWTSDQKQLLLEHCSDLMTRFGYPLNEELKVRPTYQGQPARIAS